MSWLKQNWFKVIIGAGVVLISFSFLYYYVLLPQSPEKLKDNIEFLPAQSPIPTKEVQAIKSPIPKEDPLIKVEKCKLVSSQIAEREASKVFMDFFNKNFSDGQTTACRDFLKGYSTSTEQCWDIGKKLEKTIYENTYNSEYQTCLSK